MDSNSSNSTLSSSCWKVFLIYARCMIYLSCFIVFLCLHFLTMNNLVTHFFRLRLNKFYFLNHLRVFLRSKKYNVILDFTKLKCSIYGLYFVNNTIYRAHFTIRILLTRVNNPKLEKKLYRLHF